MTIGDVERVLGRRRRLALRLFANRAISHLKMGTYPSIRGRRFPSRFQKSGRLFISSRRPSRRYVANLKPVRPSTKATLLFFFVWCGQLHQERKHSPRQVLRNLIERLQFLSNRSARGTARHCFRPRHVIRLKTGSRVVISHERQQ